MDKTEAQNKAIHSKTFKTSDVQGNNLEQSFIRAGNKKEHAGGTARSKGFNTIPDKEGHEKVYKPYGEHGKGYYYSKKI